MRHAALTGTLVFLLAVEAFTYVIGVPATAAVAVAMALVGAVALWRVRAMNWWHRLPLPLMGLLILAVLSLAWSAYPAATAVGLARTVVVVTIAVAVVTVSSWSAILAALGAALRIILVASVLFEVFVATVIRHPVLPLVPPVGVDYATFDGDPPLMLMWSRNELGEALVGGRIQGVVGNATILGFIAVLGVIVFATELLSRRVPRWLAITSLGIAALVLVLTASATGVAALVVALGVAVLTWSFSLLTSPAARRLASTVTLFALVAGLIVALVFREQLLRLLGRSADLTGRVEIWGTVGELAQQRPAFGHGWVGYWIPWVAPFDTLVERNGVRQLQAHSAWVDLWLQLGIVGICLMAFLLITAILRGWSAAISGWRRSHVAAVAPVALLVAITVQSFVESRVLVDGGLTLLVILTTVLHVRAESRSPGTHDGDDDDAPAVGESPLDGAQAGVPRAPA